MQSADIMKTLSQIAFDFGLNSQVENHENNHEHNLENNQVPNPDPNSLEKPAAAAAIIERKEEDPAINVGIRIKALKQQAAPQVVETPRETSSKETPKGLSAEALPVKNVPGGKTEKKSTRGRKSIKETEAEADLLNIPSDEDLFKKQYYSIGEVAEMFKVNHSLLRYWENEFDILQPRKNRKGDRHFRPIDIKNLHLIYHLLRQRKYTIEGAKDFLKKNKKAEERFAAIQKLNQVREFLLEIKANL